MRQSSKYLSNMSCSVGTQQSLHCLEQTEAEPGGSSPIPAQEEELCDSCPPTPTQREEGNKEISAQFCQIEKPSCCQEKPGLPYGFTWAFCRNEVLSDAHRQDPGTQSWPSSWCIPPLHTPQHLGLACHQHLSSTNATTGHSASFQRLLLPKACLGMGSGCLLFKLSLHLLQCPQTSALPVFYRSGH